MKQREIRCSFFIFSNTLQISMLCFLDRCHLQRIFLLAGEDTASRIFVADLLFFLFRGDGDSLNKGIAVFLFLGDAVSIWDEAESTSMSFGTCFLTALVKWFSESKHRRKLSVTKGCTRTKQKIWLQHFQIPNRSAPVTP